MMVSTFKYLIPGDIIWYGGHIMIVSSIKEPDGYDENNEPYWNDGSGVKVMESTYNIWNEGKSKLFGCGKIRNCILLTDKGKTWEIWRQK